MSKFKEPWSYRTDDTGGEFTGYPSIQAPEEFDLTIIHRAGFKQEFWGDLSRRDCVAYAGRIVACVNACAGIANPETTIPALLEALSDLHDAAQDVWNLLAGARPPVTIPEALDAIVEKMAQARSAVAQAKGDA